MNERVNDGVEAGQKKSFTTKEREGGQVIYLVRGPHPSSFFQSSLITRAGVLSTDSKHTLPGSLSSCFVSFTPPPLTMSIYRQSYSTAQSPKGISSTGSQRSQITKPRLSISSRRFERPQRRRQRWWSGSMYKQAIFPDGPLGFVADTRWAPLDRNGDGFLCTSSPWGWLHALLVLRLVASC